MEALTRHQMARRRRSLSLQRLDLLRQHEYKHVEALTRHQMARRRWSLSLQRLDLLRQHEYEHVEALTRHQMARRRWSLSLQRLNLLLQHGYEHVEALTRHHLARRKWSQDQKTPPTSIGDIKLMWLSLFAYTGQGENTAIFFYMETSWGGEISCFLS